MPPINESNNSKLPRQPASEVPVSPQELHDLKQLVTANKCAKEAVASLKASADDTERNLAATYSSAGLREKYLPQPLAACLAADTALMERIDRLSEESRNISTWIEAGERQNRQASQELEGRVEAILVQSDPLVRKTREILDSVVELRRAVELYEEAVYGALSVFLAARWDEKRSLFFQNPFKPVASQVEGGGGLEALTHIQRCSEQYEQKARALQVGANDSDSVVSGAVDSRAVAAVRKVADAPFRFHFPGWSNIFKLQDGVDALDGLLKGVQAEVARVRVVELSLVAEIREQIERFLSTLPEE